MDGRGRCGVENAESRGRGQSVWLERQAWWSRRFLRWESGPGGSTMTVRIWTCSVRGSKEPPSGASLPQPVLEPSTCPQMLSKRLLTSHHASSKVKGFALILHVISLPRPFFGRGNREAHLSPMQGHAVDVMLDRRVAGNLGEPSTISC